MTKPRMSEYEQIMRSLFKAIEDYRTEHSLTVECPFSRKEARERIFQHYAELENLAKK